MYAHHKRVFLLHHNKTCPRVLFRENLIKQLKEWKLEGESSILMIDANENMETGKLSHQLSESPLFMIDAVKSRRGRPGPVTWFRGSAQIEGVWVTKDVTVSATCFLPFYFGAGDHRAIMIDIPTRDLIGTEISRIVLPSIRRLQCQNPKVNKSYLK